MQYIRPTILTAVMIAMSVGTTHAQTFKTVALDERGHLVFDGNPSSLRAGGLRTRSHSGELITKPVRFSGLQVEINLGCSAAGGFRVEIQDGKGQAIAGFGLALRAISA